MLEPVSLRDLLTYLYLGLVLYVDVAHVAVLAVRRLGELGQPKRHHLPAAAIDPVLAGYGLEFGFGLGFG